MNINLILHKVKSSKESAGAICFIRSNEIEIKTINDNLTDAEIESAICSALWAMNEAGCFSFVADNERIFVNDFFIYDHLHHLLRRF
jgi:hypothetical protein